MGSSWQWKRKHCRHCCENVSKLIYYSHRAWYKRLAVYVDIYIYIALYIEREREKERESFLEPGITTLDWRSDNDNTVEQWLPK